MVVIDYDMREFQIQALRDLRECEQRERHEQGERSELGRAEKAEKPDLQEIAEKLTEGEGVKVDAETIRKELLEPWYQSTIRSPASIKLQKTAARTFGHSPNVHLRDAFDETEINWDLLYPMAEIYNNTQRYLKEEEGLSESQTIPVYHPYLPSSAGPKKWSKGDVVRISLNPLTSWTRDIREAAVFADFLSSEGTPAFVLKTFIPVKSIVSIQETGFGETPSEVVLAGGEFEAIVEIKAG